METRVQNEFVGRNHLEGPQGHHLAFEIDLVNHSAEPIQFGEVFRFYLEILAIQFDGFGSFPSALDEYLLVLSREELPHVLHSRIEFVSLCGKFRKFEIFRTDYHQTYLQKYFLVGKWVAPLKLTPCTT